MNQNITQKPEMKSMLTHGLLSEDFKQNLLRLVQEHPLDIQTKAIVLDSILIMTNILAKQQTEMEIAKYNESCLKQKNDDEKVET